MENGKKRIKLTISQVENRKEFKGLVSKNLPASCCCCCCCIEVTINNGSNVETIKNVDNSQ